MLMHSLRSFLTVAGALALAASPVCAHRDHDHDDDHDEAAMGPAADIPTVVVDVNQTGPNPWSHLGLHNDPDNFQFAIITDNTTGGRLGIVEDAFKKLNWLQPEFVMSVGDLIQGYTKDRAQLTFEWDQFEGFVSQLEMPFFYVAGNHDYTNPVQAEVWAERFGASYYHFTYRDVLFIMLNSNDAGRPHVMTQPQVDWLAEVLAQNPDPRWTLVFIHTPLWNMPKPGLWPEVEQLLAGRQHTVFAGHHHRYVKDVRNGRSNYYTLASTGGNSDLRGPRFGEFDHVMWATMTDEGPILANLVLEGILPEDVRDTKTKEMQVALIDDGSLAVQPLIFRGEHFTGGHTELRFTNDTDLPVTLEYELTQTANVPFAGVRRQSLDVPPNEVVAVPLRFGPADLSFDSGEIARLAWKLRFEHHGEDFVFDDVEEINAVRAEPIPARTVAVDGDLSDWEDRLPYHYDGADWLYARDRVWGGRADLDYHFGVAADADYLYVAVEVIDDGHVIHEGERNFRQDSVTIEVDARPAPLRNLNQGRFPLRYTLLAAESPDEPAEVLGANRLPEGSQQVAVRTERGYVCEIAVPVAYLDAQAGAAWEQVRLNVIVTDSDPDKQGRLSLSWQPTRPDFFPRPGVGTFGR